MNQISNPNPEEASTKRVRAFELGYLFYQFAYQVEHAWEGPANALKTITNSWLVKRLAPKIIESVDSIYQAKLQQAIANVIKELSNNLSNRKRSEAAKKLEDAKDFFHDEFCSDSAYGHDFSKQFKPFQDKLYSNELTSELRGHLNNLWSTIQTCFGKGENELNLLFNLAFDLHRTNYDLSFNKEYASAIAPKFLTSADCEVSKIVVPEVLLKQYQQKLPSIFNLLCFIDDSEQLYENIRVTLSADPEVCKTEDYEFSKTGRLGLKLFETSRKLGRVGHEEEISFTVAAWSLILPLATAERTYGLVSHKSLQKNYVPRTGMDSASTSIKTMMVALRKELKVLGIGIKGERDRGYRLSEIDSSDFP